MKTKCGLKSVCGTNVHPSWDVLLVLWVIDPGQWPEPGSWPKNEVTGSHFLGHDPKLKWPGHIFWVMTQNLNDRVIFFGSWPMTGSATGSHIFFKFSISRFLFIRSPRKLFLIKNAETSTKVLFFNENWIKFN